MQKGNEKPTKSKTSLIPFIFFAFAGMPNRLKHIFFLVDFSNAYICEYETEIRMVRKSNENIPNQNARGKKDKINSKERFKTSEC